MLDEYERLDLKVMNELRADINDLLLEGVDNTSCFQKLFRICQSLSIKKKFKRVQPERFEKLYIGFFIIQVLIFYIFIKYLQPEFTNFSSNTPRIQTLTSACWLLFTSTIAINLMLSCKPAGPICQPSLRHENDPNVKKITV